MPGFDFSNLKDFKKNTKEDVEKIKYTLSLLKPKSKEQIVTIEKKKPYINNKSFSPKPLLQPRANYNKGSIKI